MADAKESEAVAAHPTAYDEKIEDSTAKHNEFPENTARRQSVALNIVENPLKVSCAIITPLALRCATKVTIGLTGLWQPSVHSDVAF
jgi:hypothetical protein